MQTLTYRSFLEMINFVARRRDHATGLTRVWGHLLDRESRYLTFWLFQGGTFQFKYADSYEDRSATVNTLTAEKLAKGYCRLTQREYRRWPPMKKAYRDYLRAVKDDNFYQGAPRTSGEVGKAVVESIPGTELTGDLAEEIGAAIDQYGCLPDAPTPRVLRKRREAAARFR